MSFGSTVTSYESSELVCCLVYVFLSFLQALSQAWYPATAPAPLSPPGQSEELELCQTERLHPKLS